MLNSHFEAGWLAIARANYSYTVAMGRHDERIPLRPLVGLLSSSLTSKRSMSRICRLALRQLLVANNETDSIYSLRYPLRPMA